jgi:hypothetical protein
MMMGGPYGKGAGKAGLITFANVTCRRLGRAKTVAREIPWKYPGNTNFNRKNNGKLRNTMEIPWETHWKT